MSTAGKVLSVLVALMVLVSIYLLSMVSQLNRNWGKGIDRVSTEIVQLDDQTRQAQVDASAIQQQIMAERLNTDARLSSLRLRIEELENRLTLLKEDQLRLQIRLDEEQSLIARMQDIVAGREQEQAELQARLDDSNALRDRLASENSEKLDRLMDLRDRLDTLVAENQELLERVADRGREPAEAENTE